MPYTVSTPVFEGPFDLLLHLITREQVDLAPMWEVSLSSIVDEYVATLAQMTAALDLETATEFLLIAAVLLELKARRLLPGREDIDPEDELALWEERDLLLSRLLECKTFKDASMSLSKLMDNAARSFPRTAGLEAPFVDLAPDLLEGVTPAQLQAAMEGVLAPKPVPHVSLDHVAPIRTTVGEAVSAMASSLRIRRRATFAELTAGLDERVEVIIRFLAVLELYKQGEVELEQAANFAALHVTWTGASPSMGDPASGSPLVDEYQG